MSASKASVTVPRAWFEQCYLPGVCARTGVDTTDTHEMTAEHHNPLIWIGLIFGLIGVLLADLILVKKSHGRIPFADTSGLEQRRNTGIVIATVGGCMFLGVFTGVEALVVLGLLGILVLIVGLVYIIRARKLGMDIKLSSDLMMVTLKNVHPRFAAATTDLLNRARQAEQPAPAQFNPNELYQPT